MAYSRDNTELASTRATQNASRRRTWPGRGVGKRCNLNELAPYLCVVSPSRFAGRLMIWMASNGHFFTQIPHPMHSSSEMNAIFVAGVTSTQSLPILLTGQYVLHSCLHFLGLHRSSLTTAIRWGVSSAPLPLPEFLVSIFFFGGMVVYYTDQLLQRPVLCSLLELCSNRLEVSLQGHLPLNMHNAAAQAERA
jgi:hypothetical protein